MVVPGHEDGVVQEVLEDLAVLGLLLLRLLLSQTLGVEPRDLRFKTPFR